MSLLLFLALSAKPVPACVRVSGSYKKKESIASIEIRNQCKRELNLSTAVVRFKGARPGTSWADVPLYFQMISWEPIEQGFVLIREDLAPAILRKGDAVSIHWFSAEPAREINLTMEQ